MIDVKCSQCKTGFQIDVPQEIWDADLATRSEWAFSKIHASVMTSDLAPTFKAVAQEVGTIDANTEELLLYRVCEKCWEDDSDDY